MNLESPVLTAILAGVTGLFGFLSGLYKDSWKKRFEHREDRRRLRDALYVEFALNLRQMLMYVTMVHSSQPQQVTSPPLKDLLSKAVFSQALSTQPILLHELVEIEALLQFYRGLSAAEGRNVDEQIRIFGNMNVMVDSYVKEGQLSRRRIARTHKAPGYHFAHPLRRRFERVKSRMMFRNASKDVPKDEVVTYAPTDTIGTTFKALWRGRPERAELPPTTPQL